MEQKSALDENCPPGEESNRSSSNLGVYARFGVLMLALGGGFALFGGYMARSKPVEARASISQPNDQDKFQLLRLGVEFSKKDYQALVAQLDSIGFRISTQDEFMDWNKDISPVKRREFSGEIMTIVQLDKDSVFGLVYEGHSNLRIERYSWHGFLLIVRKDAPKPPVVKPEEAEAIKKAGGKEPEAVADLSADPVVDKHVLRIDRSQPFNPATLIGEDWSIWRGSAYGDGLTGEEQQDINSLVLREVDFSKVILEAHFKKGETIFVGETLQWMKQWGVIRLDAGVAQALYEEEDHKTLEWLRQQGVRCLHFMGTELRSCSGHRCVPCLCWDDGKWVWHGASLRRDWMAGEYSVVLAR